MNRYRIPDDPAPSGLRRFAVGPQWPVTATMLVGAWLAWPWLVFNAFALGAPTRHRQARTIALGSVGVVAAGAGLLASIDAGWISGSLAIRLGLLAFFALKLGIVYSVVLPQTRAAGIVERQGGTLRMGLVVVVVGILLRPLIVGLVDSVLWRLVVSGDWFLWAL